MTLAITFISPLLLLGLAAAAIPLVLHLLASVRAPQELFPTLRFLKMGMEKTARRRRLEHWLLLLIRSALLALLAMALAEPILKSTAGFWADKRFAAVIIVDNSWSMGVQQAGATRLDAARREASKLLGGSDRPSASALILTNSSDRPRNLRSDLEVPRQRLSQAGLSSGRADMTECVREALTLLKNSTAPQKAIYLFSDMQRISFENLPGLAELDTAGVSLMLVDCSDGAGAVNVGIEKVKITGSRIAGRNMKFTATLINSSATDKEAHVWLQVDGAEVGEPVRKILPAAQNDAPSRTDVQFVHAFGEPGVHVGQVAVRVADDLTVDNVRRFSLQIGGEVRTLLVVGAGRLSGEYDHAAMLAAALDSAESWSIRRRTVMSDRFDAKSLTGAQVVFFADVPEFTAEQAAAVVRFVRSGRSVVFFLGPAAKASNYNERFAGMLPGRIAQALGQVGMEASGLRAVKNLRHRYLAGLYETPAEYPEVIIQRYYRLERLIGDHETVLSSPAGDAIISARDFGAGRVILATTTAGTEWNNLAATTLLLPMVTRICFASAEHLGADNTFIAGSAITIRPVEDVTGKSAVNVTMPDGSVEVLTVRAGSEAVFTKTNQVGIYRWDLISEKSSGPNRQSGAFAINPAGVESDLSVIAPGALAEAIKSRDAEAGVYFGGTLEDVHKSAADAAAGDNLWDRLLAVVILLLVIEAVIANRFRRGSELTPAHLNPSLSA